jgi:hypothetical protein
MSSNQDSHMGDHDPQVPPLVTISAAHLETLTSVASMAQSLINHMENRLIPPTPSASPSLPPASSVVRSPKANPPTPFSGEQRGELDAFLSQCRLYFLVSPELFPTDTQKVLYAGSYLVGNAHTWFEPLLQSYERHREQVATAQTTGEPVRTPCPAIFASYATFSSALQTMFGDPDLRRNKAFELNALRQTSTVAVYASEFLRLRAYTNWNEDALHFHFYNGLRENVKDDLARFENQDISFEELLRRAQQVDLRIVQRINERKAHSASVVSQRRPTSTVKTDPHHALPTPPPPPRVPSPAPPTQPPAAPDGTTPMILDSGRNFPQKGSGPRQLSPQERDRRMKNNLCVFCGASGHFKAECPLKALSDQRRAAQANSVSRYSPTLSATNSYAPPAPSDDGEVSYISENAYAQE